MTTNAELVQRADVALSDLTNGGLLLPEQFNKFYRSLQDSPTILPLIRKVAMAKPAMQVDKIDISGRVLHPAAQGNISDPANNSYTKSARALTREDRTKPTTGKITLSTVEYITEVDIPYEVLEDNIEKEQLQATIMEMLQQKIAYDLEDLIINGDTTNNEDAFLKTQDGILKLATAHPYDAEGQEQNVALYAGALKMLPNKYHAYLNNYTFFLNPTREIDLRAAVAERRSDLGDAYLTSKAPIQILGVPVRGASRMAATDGILLNPQDVTMGIHRDIRVEMDRDIRERAIILVVTMRVGVTIVDTDRMVKITNIGDTTLPAPMPVKVVSDDEDAS